MAVFYKYEYRNKRKNIHPCSPESADYCICLSAIEEESGGDIEYSISRRWKMEKKELKSCGHLLEIVLEDKKRYCGVCGQGRRQIWWRLEVYVTKYFLSDKMWKCTFIYSYAKT